MITVAIVDDEPLIRAGIAALIDAHPDLSVVGQAADGDEAAALVQRTRPDVVLMDLRMTRLSGIEATRAVCAADPAPPVLMLTTFEREDYLLAALEAGASGFALKNSRADQLADAIRVVAAGVNPVDWKIREGGLKDRLGHRLPLTLGWDVSGVVGE